MMPWCDSAMNKNRKDAWTMLEIIIMLCILLIAIFHVWICALEMIFWQKPLGLKTFRIQPDFARQSAVLAANQGLYNVFLSAGLFWSLLSRDPVQALHLKIFFLGCVALAGIFGGVTASVRILIIQGTPAIFTLVLVALSMLS
jgi:putative membrane protein